jgi:hypothetical protein
MYMWIKKLWYAHLRRIDIQVLWPLCKEKSESLGHAKAIFAVHAVHDRAWLILGTDEIIRRIDQLT